jgi:hypothetical protein
MIQPEILIQNKTVQSIVNNSTVPIIEIPSGRTPGEFDVDYIDLMKNQFLPNNIIYHTVSDVDVDMGHLIKLLGAYCQEGSIDQIKAIVSEIHEILTVEVIDGERYERPASHIKSWVKALNGIHPKIDEYLKQEKAYFKEPFSELIGSNTLLFSAGTNNLDILFWSKEPLEMTNDVAWSTDLPTGPSYLREHMRHKLPNEVVHTIQHTNYTTQSKFFDKIKHIAHETTGESGAIKIQTHPIDRMDAHGSSLNYDHYHHENRILDGNKAKYWAKHDSIYKMYDQEEGHLVHLMINHLEPLVYKKQANSKMISMQKPLGVEETFPRANPDAVVNILNNGQRSTKSEDVEDSMLVPETVIVEGLTDESL